MGAADEFVAESKEDFGDVPIATDDEEKAIVRKIDRK